MGKEEGIKKRLEDTQAILANNAGEMGKAAGIRKSAMRGGEITAEDQKWLVRTVNDTLLFKQNVLEMWIEDDNKTLANGPGGKSEPKLSPGVMMGTAPQEEEPPVVEEEPPGVEEKEPDKTPEPAVEGMDAIRAMLG